MGKMAILEHQLSDGVEEGLLKIHTVKNGVSNGGAEMLLEVFDVGVDKAGRSGFEQAALVEEAKQTSLELATRAPPSAREVNLLVKQLKRRQALEQDLDGVLRGCGHGELSECVTMIGEGGRK